MPLILLVVLRRVRGRARRGGTALALGLLLGGEFLISEEILATLCLFGAIAFLLAYAVERGQRPVLRALALDIVSAAPLALALAAPVLLVMFKGLHEVAHPANWGTVYAVDLLNFLLPTASSWFGGQVFMPISDHFTGALDEQTGYLGLPALLLLGTILGDGALRRRLWLPLGMLGLALLAALGPVLQADGKHTSMILPWALIVHLPLLGAALPGRCMLYAFLALSVICSLWLAVRPVLWRVAAVACVCLSLLPTPHPIWPAPESAFFRPGRVQQILGPNPTLLILPFGMTGPSTFWQAENEFGFTQVGGYLGFPPGWAQHDPAVMQLFGGQLQPGFARDLARLCQLRQAQYVVAGPGTPADELAALASLRWSAQKIDDVTIFTVPQPAIGTR